VQLTSAEEVASAAADMPPPTRRSSRRVGLEGVNSETARTDKDIVRALSLISAVLHVTVIAAAALLMCFLATFPFENQTPESAAADDWLLVAAPVVLGLAIAFAVAIAVLRVALVVGVGLLATEFAADAVVVRYALGASDHSDGRLLLAALAVTVTGVAAVIAARRARASYALRLSHRYQADRRASRSTPVAPG
jgi:hypothetical protein